MTAAERDAKYKKLFSEATALWETGKPAEAIPLLRQAAATNPQLWCDNALAMAKAGHPDLALECLYELLNEAEGESGKRNGLDAPIFRAGAWLNIGNVYSGQGQNDPALECFRKSWAILPTAAAAGNIALTYSWQGKLSDSKQWIANALRLDPWLSDAQLSQAMISLLSGDYRTGFQQYECRWRSGKNGLFKIPSDKPEWDGSEAPGKTILIYGEQGSGDSILLLRYARLIKEKGLRQIWALQKGLKPLAATLGVIDNILEVGEKLPEYDLHLPAASLPYALNTSLETIPEAPYMPRPPRAWLRGLSVGIAWRGSKVQGNDKFRSTNLSIWEPVLNIPGVNFHSLQVDGAEEALSYSQLIMHDPPRDWLETARRVASMDLIISVDTSIVHLSGALGVPCWCALHCRPYFVYPLTHPEATPWYSSVRLFRQAKELEWEPVFEKIANELKNLCAKS